MARKEIDQATGTETTGHEWDGIKELNTPLPKWWLYTFYATIPWGLIYTLFSPACPWLSGQTAARYHLGYAPAGWQGLGAAFERYDDKALVECGLVVENEGKRYDRFRDRVMFPIRDQRGLVIGFGGRVIPGDDGPAAA